MVGDARFELTTSPTRTVRATGLRQSPTRKIKSQKGDLFNPTDLKVRNYR